MATIRIDGDEVVITLTRFEHVFGFLRDRRIPRSLITEVAVEPEPFRAIRGIRAPGLAVPWRVAIGTWRGRRGRMFVCARAHEPALRLVTPADHAFQAYVVSVDDASALAEQLGAVAR